MAVQIQTRAWGRGLDQPWEVWGEWRGKKLPKYAQKDYADFIREREVNVRITRTGEPEFIEYPRKG